MIIIIFIIIGLDKIEFLQSHNNNEIYQKVYDVIEKYFGSEEDDTVLIPRVENDQFVFTSTNSSIYNQQQQSSGGDNDAGGFQF